MSQSSWKNEAQERSSAAESPLLTTTGAREWCEGLPLVGIRALTEEERDELEVIRVVSRAKCVRWGCATPIMLIVSMGLGTALDPSDAAVFLGLCIPVYTLSMCICAGEASKRTRLALTINSVNAYSGHVTRGEEGSRPLHFETQRTLGTRETLNTLEVLAGNRTLWSVNGIRATSKNALTTSATSDPPSLPSYVTFPSVLPPTQSALPPTTDMGTEAVATGGQRILSAQERIELLQYAERWKRSWLTKGLIFTVPIGGILALLPHVWRSIEPVMWVENIAMLWFLFKVVSGLRHYRRLQHDARYGEVKVKMCFYPSSNSKQTWPEGTEVVEVLPTSGRVWTYDGEAAEWRHQGSGTE